MKWEAGVSRRKLINIEIHSVLLHRTENFISYHTILIIGQVMREKNVKSVYMSNCHCCVSGWPRSGQADVVLGAAAGVVWVGLPGRGSGKRWVPRFLSPLIAFGITGPPPDCSLAQTQSHLKADLFLNLFPQVRLERSYHIDPMTGPLPRGLPAPDGTLSDKCVCVIPGVTPPGPFQQ